MKLFDSLKSGQNWNWMHDMIARFYCNNEISSEMLKKR